MAKSKSISSTMVDMTDGGGNSKIPWDKLHPAQQAPSTLKEALGTKGRPMGMERALSGANPYYSGNYREYSENCQRAVVAYELRRRGYDVIAQPTFKNDVLPSMGRWQGSFQGAKRESIGASTTAKARDNLRQKMQSYGPGSRAIVGVNWKSGGGHVFNVENVGGRIHYIDAQTGVRYNPKTILNGTKSGSVSILRTDNLRISDRAKKSVRPR